MPKDIENLILGYQQFRKRYFSHPNSDFEELVLWGQNPKVLMIACSDSRVDPAIVMNCRPGDLFVIRNVANLIPPYEDDQSYHGTSAALQFGVCNLDIRHIILFGHTQCGGIQALLRRSPNVCQEKSFIAKWMELAKPAYEAVIEHHFDQSFAEQTTLCGHYSLVNSLRNLETFPWIAERVKKNSLFLHAWNFDLERGILEAYDSEERCFKELKNNENSIEVCQVQTCK
ncbi:MAG: carbonic anhydrase [Proteobacteria bacterium]|nr:carbonic anhydrase [Pseudomonadota bacterium]